MTSTIEAPYVGPTSQFVAMATPVAGPFAGAELAFITNYTGNTLSMIVTSNGSSLGTVATGNGPVGIAATPTNVYVANNSAGSVTVVDTASFARTAISNSGEVTTVSVGDNPLGTAVTPDGPRV